MGLATALNNAQYFVLRIASILIMFVALLALPLCGGAGAAPAAALKVAFITNSSPGDCSPGDYAVKALQKVAAERQVQYDVIHSSDPEKQGEDFAAVAGNSKYDLILLADRFFVSMLFDQAGNYPKARFGIIDRVLKAPNIVSVEFADYDAAFLAGAAAAMLTTRTGIQGINHDQKIAFIGSDDGSRQRALFDAFTMGAKHVAPKTEIFRAVLEDTASPTKGRIAALELFHTGSDIIMQAAGKSGLGVIEAARETGLFAIGMDVDQSELAPDNVIGSVIKRYDLAVAKLISLVAEGKFKGNTTIEMNLKNDGVAFGGLKNKRLSGGLPADIADRLKKLTKEINSGLRTLPPKPKGRLCDC